MEAGVGASFEAEECRHPRFSGLRCLRTLNRRGEAGWRHRLWEQQDMGGGGSMSGAGGGADAVRVTERGR